MIRAKKILLLAAAFLSAVPALAGNDATELDESQAVSIPISKNRKFFYSISASVMDMAENGDPKSLRQVYASLRKGAAEEYTETEKLVLYMISSVMKIAWPSEDPGWNFTRPQKENQYLWAIDAAFDGIYETNTHSTDFFSSILPALSVIRAKNSDSLENCEASVKKALAIRENSALANYVAGLVAMKKNDLETSLSYLKRAESLYPSSREISMSLGKTEILLGDCDGALARGKSILEKSPTNKEALELCAQALFQKGDLSGAEEYAAKLVMSDSSDIESILLRAKILLEKKDFIHASSLLDVCAKSTTRNKNYLILRSRMQWEWNKNLDTAAVTASEALSLYKDDAGVLELCAGIASESGKKIGGMNAMELALKTLEKSEGNRIAEKILVSECFKAGDFQKAYDTSTGLMKKNAVDEETCALHAEICIASNRTKEALNLGERLYRENPESEVAQQVYIKTLLASGDRNTASQVISRHLENAGQRMKSFLYYERSFVSAGEEAVLADLRSSLTSNPRNKDALYRLYGIYYRKSDWRRAQYYLKQVVALDPHNESLLEKIAELDAKVRK